MLQAPTGMHMERLESKLLSFENVLDTITNQSDEEFTVTLVVWRFKGLDTDIVASLVKLRNVRRRKAEWKKLNEKSITS